jgi:hypothetical protein
MTMEMNITENSDRWPTTRVATPTDQARLTLRISSIGAACRRMKARSRRAR